MQTKNRNRFLFGSLDSEIQSNFSNSVTIKTLISTFFDCLNLINFAG